MILFPSEKYVQLKKSRIQKKKKNYVVSNFPMCERKRESFAEIAIIQTLNEKLIKCIFE